MTEPPVENGTSQDTPLPLKPQKQDLAKLSTYFGCFAWILPGVLLAFFALAVICVPNRVTPLHEWLLPGFLYSLLIVSPVLALLGVVLGHIAHASYGRNFGYAMLILIVFAMSAIGLFFHAVDVAKGSSCRNNLKQMAVIFEMYCSENRAHLLPESSPYPGKLALLNKGGLYPEYLTDPSVLFCTETKEHSEIAKRRYYSDPGSNPDPQALFDNSSYMYLGYAVSNDADVQAFADAYKERVASGLPFNEDLPVKAGSGHEGEDKIHRLYKGVGKFFFTDAANPKAADLAQSKLPVLIEKLGNHKPEGGNVLFLDGHVEFVRYPGEWPMTEKTMAILQSLQALAKH